MDSFYDAPRRPPQPIPKETFLATPVVPEISVLCPSNTPRNAFTPYNEWKKETMPNNFLLTNKENFNCPFQSTQNNSILKKQVRFESPVLQQKPVENTDPFLNKTQPDSGKNQNDKTPDQVRVVPSFEQMYMANIPNRQLDLSVIDLPKRITQNESNNQYCEANKLSTEAQSFEKEQPKTYREFLECQKKENKVVFNDSVTDIFNYKRNNSASPKPIHNTHRVDEGVNNKVQQTPVLTPNVYQPFQKDIKYDLKGNNGRINPDQHFQHVTDAISRRDMPEPYENAYKKGAEPTRAVKYDQPWFRSQNNDCAQLETNRNQVLGNDVLKKCSEDTQNKESIQNNIPTRQKDTIQSAPYYHTRQECYTQTTNDLNNSEDNGLKLTGGDDFCVKDLLKIIAQQSHQISQQNKQLLLLQKQVSTLIDQQKENGCSRRKSIQCKQERNCCQQENDCYNRITRCCKQEQHYEQKQACIEGAIDENRKNVQGRCITSTQHENCDGVRKKLQATPKKNNLPNFSIGLTTSFEVSFKRPTKNQDDFLQKNKHLPDFNQYEPLKIQEINETDSTESQKACRITDNENRETLIDESLIFKEPIRVRESCPSPEPSIKIDMKDFEDSESEDDFASLDIQPSFYRNLMIQVNKILQKAQIETETVAYNIKGQHLKQNTLHKVKEATLKHLNRIGVEVPNSDDSSQSSNSSDDLDSKSYNQEDISFAVKQLLMKYLPADHLAKVASYKAPQPVNQQLINAKEKMGAIKNRPDFSFATVQYMKKYNLIANNQKNFCRDRKRNQPESPKVLDITKLKQQPKLL